MSEMANNRTITTNYIKKDPIMNPGKLIIRRSHLSLQVSMIGLNIIMINQISIHGKQKLITLLQEIRQFGLKLNLTGHSFSMSLPKDHHQVNKTNFS